MKSIRNLFYLVDFPVKFRLILSVIGALFVSLLEILGVLATYPLLLVASGQGNGNALVSTLSNFLGTDNQQQLIIIFATVVIFAFLSKGIFTIGFRWWQNGFINSVERSARVNLLSHYLDSPYENHKKRDLPTLHTNLVTAVSQAYNQTISGLLSLLTSIMTVFFIFMVLIFVSPFVALFALAVFSAVGYIIPAVFKKRLKNVSQRFTEADRLSWYSSMPALVAFREVRLFGVSQEFVDGYSEGAGVRARASREQAVISEMPKNIVEIVFVVSIAVLATYVFSTKGQAEAVAIMGSFSVAAVRMMPAINSAVASLNAMRAGSAGVGLINQEIDGFKQMVRYSEVPVTAAEFDGDILVKDLTFQYSGEGQKVLDGISIRIPANKTVAFVGPSGSGKSTLVDIVLGMLEPTEGAVICGGDSVHENLRSWHSLLSVVPQSIYVLPGSLKTNVAFGQPEEKIDTERVKAALHHAELDELVASLPAGIDEDLGQEGSRLSGGQRQRLGIARALYRQPKLLVLDEATSALDNKTEHKITKTIENLSGEMTIILVAHRLSTIKRADIIFYMENGKIVNQGNFEELSRINKDFRELVELGKL